MDMARYTEINIEGKRSGIRTFAGEYDLSGLGGSKCLVVTDSNVWKLHGAGLRPALGAAFGSVSVLELSPGETAKNYDSVKLIYEKLNEAGADRTSVVAAFGGGVVCDLSGFAAATYMRGLKLVMLPTTLIAQADAAIGGKNGYNMGAKNLIGGFYQPIGVYNNVSVLATLPEEHKKSGMGELIKYAYVSPDYMRLLDGGASFLELIAEAVRIKAALVEQDERDDKGLRIRLNFGHTFGHALELTLGLPHGTAVALGILAALHISVSRGLSDAELLKAEQVMLRYGLPVRCRADAGLIPLMSRDKKNQGGFRMVLKSKEGLYTADVNANEIYSAIEYLNREAQ